LQELSKGYDKIIFHCLEKADIYKLSKLKKSNIQIIWRQWTGDSMDLLNDHLILTSFRYRHPIIKNYGSNPGKNIVFFIHNTAIKSALFIRAICRYKSIISALSNIDIVGNWNEFETSNLKQCYPSFKASFVYLPYFYVDHSLPDNTQKKISFNNILLGHSGYPDSKYEDIISFFGSEIGLKNLEVYCILSYGEKKYIDFIINYGKSALGNKFHPIVNFLNKEEYFKMLNTFDICIFNLSKPAGSGNIFRLLRMGKKVFLREENPMYKFIKDKGVKIFSINQLLRSPSLLFENMTYEDILSNYFLLTGNEYHNRFQSSMDILIE